MLETNITNTDFTRLKIGSNFLGILNDIKRRPEDAAKELGVSKELIFSIIDGKSFANMSKPLLSVLRIDIEVWPCAIEYVRYVGEPIALVLAKNRYIAEDAIENIKVTYQKYNPIIKTLESTLN